MSKLECGPQLNQRVQRYYDLLHHDTTALLTPFEGLKGYYRVSEASDTWGRIFPAQATPSEAIRTAEGQIVVNVGRWEVVLGTLAENEQLVTFNLTDCSGFAFRLQAAFSTPDIFISAHVPVIPQVAFDDLIKIIEGEGQYHVLDVLISAQEAEIPYLQDQIANHFPDARVYIDPRRYYDYGGLILAPSIGALLREVETDSGVTYTPIKCWEW